MSLDQLLVQLNSGGCFPSTKKPLWWRTGAHVLVRACSGSIFENKRKEDLSRA